MEKTQTTTLEATSKQAIKTREIAEFLIISVAALMIPFSLGHPQLLVGILVNATIVLAALNLRNWQILPILLLPSIGVLSRGLVFGPLSIFLVYMIPFIWLGNLILGYSVRGAKYKWLGLIVGAVLKMAFLYSIAIILIKLHVLPKPFAISMGMVQLYTALVGGIIALSINGLKNKILKKL